MTGTDHFDLVVLGSGPAGEKGAAQAAYFGKKVALVERARQVGGASVHTGTLPSKTLRETALYLTGFRRRELYGMSLRLSTRSSIFRRWRRASSTPPMTVCRGWPPPRESPAPRPPPAASVSLSRCVPGSWAFRSPRRRKAGSR
jgi:choline dehydrogenase-like flavoprotein